MEPVSAARVLGLRTTSPTDAELRAAWRRFAREHHPDISPAEGAAGAARFKAGHDAYESLRTRVATDDPPVAAVVHRAPARYGHVIPGSLAAGRAVPYSFEAVGTREWYA
jgi:hypothetical protein